MRELALFNYLKPPFRCIREGKYYFGYDYSFYGLNSYTKDLSRLSEAEKVSPAGYFVGIYDSSQYGECLSV